MMADAALYCQHQIVILNTLLVVSNRMPNQSRHRADQYRRVLPLQESPGVSRQSSSDV